MSGRSLLQSFLWESNLELQGAGFLNLWFELGFSMRFGWKHLLLQSGSKFPFATTETYRHLPCYHLREWGPSSEPRPLLHPNHTTLRKMTIALGPSTVTNQLLSLHRDSTSRDNVKYSIAVLLLLLFRFICPNRYNPAAPLGILILYSPTDSPQLSSQPPHLSKYLLP